MSQPPPQRCHNNRTIWLLARHRSLLSKLLLLWRSWEGEMNVSVAQSSPAAQLGDGRKCRGFVAWGPGAEPRLVWVRI